MNLRTAAFAAFALLGAQHAVRADEPQPEPPIQKLDRCLSKIVRDNRPAGSKYESAGTENNDGSMTKWFAAAVGNFNDPVERLGVTYRQDAAGEVKGDIIVTSVVNRPGKGHIVTTGKVNETNLSFTTSRTTQKSSDAKPGESSRQKAYIDDVSAQITKCLTP